MNILFVGDVFGSIGRRVLAERLDSLKMEHSIDLCIANGENSAGGIGITVNTAKKLRKYGVDIITGGNHSFAHTDKESELGELDWLLRPLNVPPGNPGKGYLIHTLPDGRMVGVLNLHGRTFFSQTMDCPFRIGRETVERIREITPILVVDFHAEATSEKKALAIYLDGTATAVLGTHTHVQTADQCVLPGGTAFITDVGMTGPEDSIIGMKKDAIVRKFLYQTHVRMEPSTKGPQLNAVILTVDDTNGRTTEIRRIFERFTFK